MNLSIFWARLLGFYSLIVCIWALCSYKKLPDIIINLINNPSISMTLGIFTILIGLAIVISHPIWRGWPLIVTILGYLIILKGLVLLFYPQWSHQIMAFWENKNMALSALPSLIIGLILLYFGFRKKVS